ncbi:MAG: methyltransferase domain-containing protein [Acidobacteria bacterium]|nr:methyltransferase domain-containing protein [Acidobacteriota bacterium]MCI0627277.1 methyltransferase domain-containing protein [Acidobacteriota bacterium]MCI0722915.1 methyltransferase domain-containing protein [Acidobacteriota bacterium]
MNPSQRFLDRFDFLRDEYLASRRNKSGKILRILLREFQNPASAVIADIGCSEGHITESLSRCFSLVVGVDIDYPSSLQGKFPFIQGDGSYLPLASDRFDGVIINHILEHVASPQSLLDEVWRVLKRGGICYLAVPNRYWPIEPHYLLPLLSWLPRSLASIYVRLARRGTHYREQLPSYWSIRRLSRRFSIQDLTPALLKTPELFFPDDPALLAKASKMKWLPEWMLKILIPAVPSWVLILRKT